MDELPTGKAPVRKAPRQMPQPLVRVGAAIILPARELVLGAQMLHADVVTRRSEDLLQRDPERFHTVRVCLPARHWSTPKLDMQHRSGFSREVTLCSNPVDRRPQHSMGRRPLSGGDRCGSLASVSSCTSNSIAERANSPVQNGWLSLKSGVLPPSPKTIQSASCC